MKRVLRLLYYVRPYALYSLLSVVLMAVVGALATFRTLLVKPIFDNVLRGNLSPDLILVFSIPNTNFSLNLQRFVPHHFHNVWNIVAVSLVGSAVIKSI